MSARRYIAIFLVSGLLLLLAALGVAVAGDPAHIFRMPAAYDRIAGLLRDGVPVGDLDSPQHRLINRALIEKLSRAPQTIILGSSRIQPFSPRGAGWPDTLNLAVEGGDLGDHLYIYSLLEQRNLMPSRAIIAVDPYIFSPNRDLMSRNGEQAAMQRIAAKLNVECLGGASQWSGFAWLPKILTLDYVIESARSLAAGLRDNGSQVTFGPDPELASSAFIKRPDGSVLFSQEIRGRSPEYIESYAATVLDHPVGRGLAFETPDACKVEVLTAFLDLMDGEGIQVSLLMLPYHPTAFGLLSREHPTLANVEQLVTQIAARRSIEILGSYDPATTDCSESDFLDMHHPKQACTKRILSRSAVPRR